MPIFLGNFIANLKKNTSEKFEYFVKILLKVLSYYKAAIYKGFSSVIKAIYKGKIVIFADVFIATICITKVLQSLSNTFLANSSLLISSIRLIIDKTLTAM